MSQIHKEHLQAGFIFGDVENKEYIYLPAGEVSAAEPLCVLEKEGTYEDISLDEAGLLIDKLSLKKCSHPSLGKKAF